MSEHPLQASTDEDTLGVASTLVKARNERGLSQAELADRSGISRSAIKGYESGRNMPGSRELKALCVTLGVSPTALLYGSEQAFSERLNGASNAQKALGETRWQLFALAKLLADDEVSSLLQLARAIVVARLGVDTANAQLEAGSAIVANLEGAEAPKTRAALNQFVAALDAEDDSILEELNALLVEWEVRKASVKGGIA